MRFSPEARRFLAPGSDRLVALAGLLAGRSLNPFVVRTGRARHLVLNSGRGKPSLAFAAHYDRVEGSPGVLDNSCACLQLVEFAARWSGRGSPAFLVIFTDAEESSGGGGAAAQGSFALARASAARGGEAGAGARASPSSLPPTFVLDVTGRGERLLLSCSPSDLFARKGLAGTRAAREHDRLTRLALAAAARAGQAPPLTHPLPWSDDLGLMLGGSGALTISLLPSGEAEILARGGRPPTWDLLHGPGDTEERAEESAFALVGSFLDAILAESV